MSLVGLVRSGHPTGLPGVQLREARRWVWVLSGHCPVGSSHGSPPGKWPCQGDALGLTCRSWGW